MNDRLSGIRVLILATFLGGVAESARADHWTAWRGNQLNGICQEKGLPITWGVGKNILWELPMPGAGGSTPAVWEKNIFLTSAEGQDLVLLCIGTDGKQKWKRTLSTGAGKSLYRGGEANNASNSPTTDGKYVYALVGSGILAAFDFEGKEIWKRDIRKEYTKGSFQIQHGMHTSPVLYEDKLYLSIFHGGGTWLLAFDKNTGKEIWKVARASDARGESKEDYTSPCIAQNGKETHLVVLGADYATAHRLEDGSEVWRLVELNPKKKYSEAFRIIASPIFAEGLVIVPTCRNTVVAAVKPSAKGTIEAGSEGEVWRKSKGSPDVPSPLVHEGLVYLNRENGVLICLDIKTGEQVYEKSIYNGAVYRGSPLYADGKIYLTCRDGNFVVVKAGRTFEQLAVNQLPDTFTASPAVSNGVMYLRGFQKLYAIRADK